MDNHRHFTSLFDFMALKPSKANEDNPNLSSVNETQEKPDSRSFKDWYGTERPGQVDEYLKHGWAEGLRKAQDALTALSPPCPTSIKRRRVYSDTGDAIDINRFYAGSFENCFIKSQKARTAAPQIITLACEIGGSCGVTADSMFWQGAAAAILADSLESAGYRVEIKAFNIGDGVYKNNHNDMYIFSIDLKAASEPLDLSRLISVTALAGFYRIYGFKARMSEKRKISEGLGRSIQAPRTAKKLLGAQIVLSGNYSKGLAENSIKEALEELGIEQV